MWEFLQEEGEYFNDFFGKSCFLRPDKRVNPGTSVPICNMIIMVNSNKSDTSISAFSEDIIRGYWHIIVITFANLELLGKYSSSLEEGSSLKDIDTNIGQIPSYTIPLYGLIQKTTPELARSWER